MEGEPGQVEPRRRSRRLRRFFAARPSPRKAWFARGVAAGLLVLSAFLSWGDAYPEPPAFVAARMIRDLASSGLDRIVSTLRLVGAYAIPAITWIAAIAMLAGKRPDERVLAFAAVALVSLPTVAAPAAAPIPGPGTNVIASFGDVIAIAAVAVTSWGAFRRWAPAPLLIQAGAAVSVAAYCVFDWALGGRFRGPGLGILPGAAGAIGLVVATFSACVAPTEERWQVGQAWRHMEEEKRDP